MQTPMTGTPPGVYLLQTPFGPPTPGTLSATLVDLFLLDPKLPSTDRPRPSEKPDFSDFPYPYPPQSRFPSDL